MTELIKTDLGTLSAVGIGLQRAGQVGSHTATATVVGSGSVSATVLIKGSNDGLSWTTAATMSASGTGSASGSAKWTDDYALVRKEVTALTGDSVATQVVTDQSGGGASGRGGGGGGGVGMDKPQNARRNIVNEQVTFLNNYGDFANPAYPLTGLMKIADISSGPGVVDHIKIICSASNAWRACELVIFVDGEVTPSVQFQFSHFGLDYQQTYDPVGHIFDNGKMKMKVQKLAAGVSTVECKFLYEIPYGTSFKAFIFQRQPIVTWWTEVSYRPGISLPYRLKSKSTNSNGPTYARGGTTGYQAAASSFLSPIDGSTTVSLPSYITATPAQLQKGSLNFMSVPAGKKGSLVGFSLGCFAATAASFNYLEANIAIYDQTQVAAGISNGAVQARYESTGLEDFFGSSFYFDEGIGNWGAYYITDYNTGNAVNGPSTQTNNLRIVFNPTAIYPNGLEFVDGAYMTLVQSATNLVSDPANAIGINSTGQVSITTGTSMSFLTLWYEWL